MPQHTPKRRSIPLRCLAGAILLLAAAGQSLRAGGQLELIVVDKDTGKPLPCRLHLTGPKKNVRKVPKLPFWHDHCAMPGKVLLRLPNGNYEFLLECGLEYLWQKGHFTIEQLADDSKRVEMRRFVNMSANGWWSGDLDVRRPARDVELLMEADDLHVAEVVTWRNDKNEWGNKPPEKPLVRFDGNRFYHLLAGAVTRSGTEVLLLNSPTLLKPPGGEGEYPPLMNFLLKARESADLWIDVDRPYWWDLPVLVATGQVDSIEMARAATSNARARSRTSRAGDPAIGSAIPTRGAMPDGRRTSTSNSSNVGCGFRRRPAAARARPPTPSDTTGSTSTSTGRSATRSGGPVCGPGGSS